MVRVHLLYVERWLTMSFKSSIIHSLTVSTNNRYSLRFNKKGLMQHPSLETVDPTPVPVFLSTVG